VSFHHRKVQERLVALQIGDPQLVRRGGGEVPVDEVRRPQRFGIRSGGEQLARPGGAADPDAAHQPVDLVAADLVPRSLGGEPQLVRRPVPYG